MFGHETKVDKVDEMKSNVTFYGVLRGNKGKIGGFNINLNGLKPEKMKDLKASLGIKSLEKNTPLTLIITRAEGEILDDWTEQFIKNQGEDEDDGE